MTLTDPLRYELSDDIMRRLVGTVVRYKGRPIEVLDLAPSSGHLRIVARDLIGDSSSSPSFNIIIHSSDVELDISSPPLGFSNAEEAPSSIYVARQPTRSQNQGVYFNRLICYGDSVEQGYPFTKKAFGRMVLGEYPNFSECADRIRGNKPNSSLAFGRYLGLQGTGDKEVLAIKHLINNVGVYYPSESRGFLFPLYDEVRLREKLKPYMELGANNA